MTRDELLALALRCEQAVGASRELDGDIAIALFGGEVVHSGRGRGLELRYKSVLNYSGVTHKRIAAYTASLDAARTLVPEGLCWRCGYGQLLSSKSGAAEILARGFGTQLSKSGGATAALALTAAALRARALMKE